MPWHGTFYSTRGDTGCGGLVALLLVPLEAIDPKMAEAPENQQLGKTSWLGAVSESEETKGVAFSLGFSCLEYRTGYPPSDLGQGPCPTPKTPAGVPKKKRGGARYTFVVASCPTLSTCVSDPDCPQ